MSAPTPPRDLLNVIEPINVDLNYDKPRASLEPYLMNLGERAPDWRCHLVSKDGTIYASYLQWQHLERHTVLMMVSGFEAQAKANVEKGKRLALEALHQHQKQLLGLK